MENVVLEPWHTVYVTWISERQEKGLKIVNFFASTVSNKGLSNEI